MRKIFVFLFTLITIQASAQFFGGVKIGWNNSNQFFTYNVSGYSYTGRYSNSSRIQTLGNWVSGIQAGIVGGYYFKNVIGLQTEFTYISMGFNFKDPADYNIKVNYLQWTPVLLKLFAGPPRSSWFFISTGFSIGVPVYSQLNTPGLVVENPDDPFQTIQVDKLSLKQYVNSPDVSWIMGLGLSFPVGNGKLEIEGRCLYGLSNVYNDAFRSGFLGLDQNIHNLNLALQTSYILFFSRRRVAY